jgi:hypothetical protein
MADILGRIVTELWPSLAAANVATATAKPDELIVRMLTP